MHYFVFKRVWSFYDTYTSFNASSTLGKAKLKNTQTSKKTPTKNTDMVCLKAPVTIICPWKSLKTFHHSILYPGLSNMHMVAYLRHVLIIIIILWIWWHLCWSAEPNPKHRYSQEQQSRTEIIIWSSNQTEATQSSPEEGK